jgi:hypothetical protein
MLLLVHNIHTGLNLNNLTNLEEYYYLNTNNGINLKNTELNFENTSLDTKNIKNIHVLYFLKNIPFSFWNPSYSSLGL